MFLKWCGNNIEHAVDNNEYTFFNKKETKSVGVFRDLTVICFGLN